MSRERSDTLVQELERELREALEIEPSLDFERRVRARIEETSGSRPPGVFRRAAPMAAAAVCVLAIGIGWQVMRDSRDPPAASTPTRLGSDVELQAPPPRTAVVERTPRSSALNATRGMAPSTPAVRVNVSEPEIILPSDQALAFARLVELARSGIVNEETLRPVAAAVAPATLEVAPLVVPPIKVPGIETGSRTAPGGATQE